MNVKAATIASLFASVSAVPARSQYPAITVPNAFVPGARHAPPKSLAVDITASAYAKSCYDSWVIFNEGRCWCYTGCALDCSQGGTPGTRGFDIPEHDEWCSGLSLTNTECEAPTCDLVANCEGTDTSIAPGLFNLTTTAGYSCTAQKDDFYAYKSKVIDPDLDVSFAMNAVGDPPLSYFGWIFVNNSYASANNISGTCTKTEDQIVTCSNGKVGAEKKSCWMDACPTSAYGTVNITGTSQDGTKVTAPNVAWYVSDKNYQHFMGQKGFLLNIRNSISGIKLTSAPATGSPQDGFGWISKYDNTTFGDVGSVTIKFLTEAQANAYGGPGGGKGKGANTGGKGKGKGKGPAKRLGKRLAKGPGGKGPGGKGPA